MALDEEFAQTYIDSNTSPDAEPQFTEDEADALLEAAKAIDVNGVSPGGTGYVPTFTYDSLHAAIYLAWTWKLAKAVELHEQDEDEIWEHCKAMVEFWASRLAGTVVGGSVPQSAGSISVANIPVW